MMLPVDSYPNLLSLVCRYLSSSEYVVHTYAASAIERLLCVKDNGVSRLDSKLLAPILEPLLVALFQTLQSEESKENEYVIKAIMRTCSVGQASMAPFASTLIQKITGILAWVSENPRNPRFNHYLFETLACLIHYLCASNPQVLL